MAKLPGTYCAENTTTNIKLKVLEKKLGEDLDKVILDYKDADKKLDDKIEKNLDSIKNLEEEAKGTAQEIANIKLKDNEQDTKLTELKNADIIINNRIDQVDTEYKAADTEIINKVNQVEAASKAKDNELDNKITANKNHLAEVDAKNAEQDNKINLIETNYKAADVELNNKITENKNKINSLENISTESGNKIAALEQEDKVINNKINELSIDYKNADAALLEKIIVNKNDINQLVNKTNATDNRVNLIDQAYQAADIELAQNINNLDIKKQDKLIAGDNIKIGPDGKTISTHDPYDDTIVKADIITLKTTKADKTELPKRVSDLENDSKFQSDAEVENSILSKGYQTETQVETLITNKKYQTEENVNTLIDAKNLIPSAEKGISGGVATLDETGRVPSSQLPAGIDEIQEYDSLDTFPKVGDPTIIYVALDTNKTYRWSGTKYTVIGSDLALGETDSTAYAGSKGKANADAIKRIETNYKAADLEIRNSITEIDTAYKAADTTINSKIDEDRNRLLNLESADVTINSKIVEINTNKQDKLIAGENIIIADDGKTIAADSGNGEHAEANNDTLEFKGVGSSRGVVINSDKQTIGNATKIMVDEQNYDIKIDDNDPKYIELKTKTDLNTNSILENNNKIENLENIVYKSVPIEVEETLNIPEKPDIDNNFFTELPTSVNIEGHAGNYKTIEEQNFKVSRMTGESRKSKNLLYFPDFEITHYGVTMTAKNGIITLNGTCTKAVDFELTDELDIPAGRYKYFYYSQGEGSHSQQQTLGNIAVMTVNKEITVLAPTIDSSSELKIINNTSTIFRLWYLCFEGASYNNYKLQVMLSESEKDDINLPPFERGFAGIKSSTIKNIENKGINLFYKDSIILGFQNGDFVKFNGIDCLKFKDSASYNAISLSFKPETQYTIQFKQFRDTENSHYVALDFIYTDGSSKRIQGNPNELLIGTSDIGKTIQNIKTVVTWGEVAYLDLTTLQIEEGTKATPYVPYGPADSTIDFNQTLRGVNNIRDELQVIQNEKGLYDIKKINKAAEIDMGSLDWKQETGIGPNCFRAIFKGIMMAPSSLTKPNIICERYTSETYNAIADTDKGISYGSPSSWQNNIIINDNQYADVFLFKESLNGQKLIYELATPTEEVIFTDLTADNIGVLMNLAANKQIKINTIDNDIIAPESIDLSFKVNYHE